MVCDYVRFAQIYSDNKKCCAYAWLFNKSLLLVQLKL